MGKTKSGTVYLLHLERPLKHARHYIGFSCNLEERLAAHANGTSNVPYLAAVRAEGIHWGLARIWDGDRSFERLLKNRHDAAALCPFCHDERLARKRASAAKRKARSRALAAEVRDEQ